ncbi:MAG: hypothetical protein NVS3B18_01640 [Candidatus Dormibacteria bacterium]
MSVARIVVLDDEPYPFDHAHVFAPYEMRELLKSFPCSERKWSPTERCWVVSGWIVNPMADALRAAGCTVYVTRADGSPYEQPKPGGTHGRRATPAPDWASVLLNAVGSDRRERVYRALSRVLHPDVETGSHELMQQLNAARDRSARP